MRKTDKAATKVFATAPRRLKTEEILKVTGGVFESVASKQGSGQDNQIGQGFQ